MCSSPNNIAIVEIKEDKAVIQGRMGGLVGKRANFSQYSTHVLGSPANMVNMVFLSYIFIHSNS